MKLFESILLGLFILFLFAGIVDVAYNVKNNKPTLPYIWIVPAIVFAIFWYIHS
jgi:hypothetical protein